MNLLAMAKLACVRLLLHRLRPSDRTECEITVA
jgi:hypothetical protein